MTSRIDNLAPPGSLLKPPRFNEKHCDNCGKLFQRSPKYSQPRWEATRFCSMKCQGLIHRTHGQTRSPEYVVWVGMLGRCTNPGNKDFHNYGGRGIGVCRRWLDSYQAFFDDMGLKPTPDHSIDRKNNDGDYEPGNCRWATRKEQQRNRRITQKVTLNGEEMTVAEAIERTGVAPSTVSSRVKMGWTLENCFDRKNHKHRPRARIPGRDRQHLANLRECPCISCGMDGGWMEAAHLRLPSAAHNKPNPGIGKKPDDKWSTPLCRKCHTRQHSIGETSFWNEVGLDPFLICEELHKVTGDIGAMRGVVMRTFRERR